MHYLTAIRRRMRDGTERTTQHGEAADAHAPSMRVNAAMNLVGAGSYSLGQWAILIVIAKTDGTVAVGDYAFGLAAAAPIVLFTNLNLAAVIATDARGEHAFGDYLALRILGSCVAFAVIAAIAGWMALSGGSGASIPAVLLIIGAAKMVDACADIFYGRCQQAERTWPIAVGLLTNGAVSLGAVIIATFISRYVVAAAVASLCGSCTALVVIVVIARRLHWDQERQPYRLRLRPRAEHLTGLARLALPLGFVMLLISLNSNIPRYLIEHSLGPEALGGFAVVASIQLIVTTTLSAVGQSIAPRMASEFAARRRSEFLHLLLKLVGVSLAMGTLLLAITALVGRQLLSLVFKPEYAQYHGLLVLLSAVTLVTGISSCLGFAATAARSFASQAPVYLASSISVAVSGILLIPPMGLTGAAVALLIGSTVCAVGSLAIVLDRLGVIRRSV